MLKLLFVLQNKIACYNNYTLNVAPVQSEVTSDFNI